MKAFFTGHRYIEGSPNYSAGVNRLIDMALSKGTNHFFVGMALGADQLAAEILTKRCLKWTAVIKSADQSELWKLRDRQRYNKLITSATKKIILYEKYSSGVMQARNLWMGLAIKLMSCCL